MQRNYRRALPCAAQLVNFTCSLLVMCFLLVQYHIARIEKSTIFSQSLEIHSTSACAAAFRHDKRCTRFLRIRRATSGGLGHQVSELVFGLHLAKSYGAILWHEMYKNESSYHEAIGYSFLGTTLGLDAFLQTPLNSTQLTHVKLSDTVNTACNVAIEGAYTDCIDGDCFRSGALALAFQEQRPCLIEVGRTFGNWHSRSPYEDKNRFNLVWHVRLGDIEPHPPDDVFYSNMCQSLRPFLTSFADVRILFLSKWDVASSDVQNAYMTKLKCLNYNYEFISPGVEDALLYMLHSDLIIGSGSSLPLVAATFSDKAIYVNVQPKHGWNFLADFLLDGLIARDNGLIVNHLHETRRKYISKNKNYVNKLKRTERW